MRVAGVILTRTQSTVLPACGAYVAADPYLLNFAMGPACNNVDGFSPHPPHRNGCVSHVTLSDPRRRAPIAADAGRVGGGEWGWASETADTHYRCPQ